ncbi:hypothetical protein KUCAC02_005125, partial [Chaenocephalus aceratus]
DGVAGEVGALVGCEHAQSVPTAGAAGSLHHDQIREPEPERLHLRSHPDSWIVPGASGTLSGGKPQTAADCSDSVPQFGA